MKLEDDYEAWKSKRSRVDVPSGFSDRVMAGIRGAHPVLRILYSRPGKIAVGILALAAGTFRILQVLGLFLA